MFSSTWARVWGFIALVAIVAVINVVAFFGALHAGFVFYQLPTEAAAASPYSERPLQLQTGSNHSNSLPAAHAAATDADDHELYPVCLLLTIGDDTSRPDDTALPFSLLYRLFDAAKAEVSEVLKIQLDELHQEQGANNSPHFVSTNGYNAPLVRLLVGVDYPSVACKMARDSLQDAGAEFQGVELTCLTPEDVRNRVLANSSQKNSKESVRVGCGTAIVGESTRYVTQLTLEWAKLIRWENVRVVDLDERDLSRNAPLLPREFWRPTVVTTFSSNHFAVGMLLLRSLGKAGMEASAAGQYNISIVVYALEEFNSTLQGILECVVSEINENYKVPTEVRQFNFSAHPSWMRINQTRGYGGGGTGEYAWKLIMMHTVLVERGFIIWTDAGCRYTVDGLVESLNYTRDFGFASKSTPGVVPQWVHPGMLKYFRYMVDYGAERKKNCDGSGVGLTLDKYESIARPMYYCGITRQCMAPDGSSRLNHRQDQSALTMAAAMSNSACTGMSMRVRKHMDYHPLNYAGTYPTQCYRDPLQVEKIQK